MNKLTNSRQIQEKALRLLIVTPRYFPMIGGVENHVYQVSRRLSGEGVEVTVLTTNPDKRLPPEEVHEGVEIRRVPVWPGKGDFYFAPGIRNSILRGSWDIVHLQSYHTFVAPIAMAAAWQARIPYLVTFHGGGHSSRLRNGLRGLQIRLMKPLFAHAERLVATAKFEVGYYGRQLRLPEDHFVYIPNGADIGTVNTAMVAPKDGDLIVSVGRLERYKGHQRILSAMPVILARRPHAHLWIAGEGPYRPQLESMARKLGVSNQVEIRSISAKDRQRMVSELSRAALMVLLSEFETHPMSVLEAACLGLPVLVADTSGLSELVEQGIAHAIPLESKPEQVAAAVLEQLARPVKPVDIELPTWDGCASDLQYLYKEIVNCARIERKRLQPERL